LGYADWIGKTEVVEDVMTAWPVRGLAATLDREPEAGDRLPPLWHWLYFLPTHRQSELAQDGHARKGSFLPPVDLPRRMWAGSRFEFFDALRVGDHATRTSRILDVKEKQGRTGPLVFVTVRHEILTARGLALSEEHDIVYRDHPRAGEMPLIQMAPLEPEWEREVQADDVLLFRYSALTFNAHRIHYDRKYCKDVEHYPGLVVHGPLLATLLLDLVRREAPAVTITAFQFRAASPVFDTEPFFVCGKREEDRFSLWVRKPGGQLAMSASAAVSVVR
jgi:3-methylfumaryl-CoA hydratase